MEPSLINRSALKILVISIADATDPRRLQTTKQLEHLGFEWEFVEGIVGKNLSSLPKEYNAKQRLRTHTYAMSLGEIGCFLSHQKAWKICADSKRPCLILEDDFELLPNFLDAIDVIFSIYDQWDIFRLQATSQCKSRPALLTQKFQGFQIIENLTDPQGSTALLVQPQAAQCLLDYSQSFYIPIDNFVESRHIHQLRILALEPYPIKTLTLPSTINDRIHPKLSWLKRVRRELGRIVRDLNRAPDSLRRSIWRLKRL